MIRKDSNTVKTVITALVLLVWGVLGWKIYQKMNRGGNGSGGGEVFGKKSAYLPDTFHLLSRQKNPFLAALAQPMVPAQVAPRGGGQGMSRAFSSLLPRERLATAPPPPMQWPDIQWMGWIYVRPGHHIAIVKQGNAVMNWKMQESKFQCQIAHISADSLVLQQGTSRKVYVRG